MFYMLKNENKGANKINSYTHTVVSGGHVANMFCIFKNKNKGANNINSYTHTVVPVPVISGGRV